MGISRFEDLRICLRSLNPEIFSGFQTLKSSNQKAVKALLRCALFCRITDLRISGFEGFGISGIEGSQDLRISGISGSQDWISHFGFCGSQDLRISGFCGLEDLGNINPEIFRGFQTLKSSNKKPCYDALYFAGLQI